MSSLATHISKRLCRAGISTLFIALSGLVQAQTPKEQMEALLIEVQQGVPIDKAMTTFFAAAPEKVPKLEIFIAQVKPYIEEGGSFSAYELVSEGTLAPSLKQVVFLSKQKNNPYFWSAYFYQGSPEKWWPIRLDVSNEPASLKNFLR